MPGFGGPWINQSGNLAKTANPLCKPLNLFSFSARAVRTTSLMKKGLRQRVRADRHVALGQNDFPDEEGIKTSCVL